MCVFPLLHFPVVANKTGFLLRSKPSIILCLGSGNFVRRNAWRDMCHGCHTTTRRIMGWENEICPYFRNEAHRNFTVIGISFHFGDIAKLVSFSLLLLLLIVLLSLYLLPLPTFFSRTTQPDLRVP